MKHIKLFEGFVDDNEKLYNKLTYSPREITIELTQMGKQYIEEQLKSWLRSSRPSYQTEGFTPDTNISIKDRVKIAASYDGENKNPNKTVEIGEISINNGRWVGDSNLTKTVNDDGQEVSIGVFQIFVEYLPLEDSLGKGAKIVISKGLRRDGINQYKELKKDGGYPIYVCEFSKVEPGEVDHRGYFRIVSVN
jgi:hypothetical protein